MCGMNINEGPSHYMREIIIYRPQYNSRQSIHILCECFVYFHCRDLISATAEENGSFEVSVTLVNLQQ